MLTKTRYEESIHEQFKRSWSRFGKEYHSGVGCYPGRERAAEQGAVTKEVLGVLSMAEAESGCL